MTPPNTKEIVLAGGCFWGLEDLIRKEPGVIDTEVGYTGGTEPEKGPGSFLMEMAFVFVFV